MAKSNALEYLVLWVYENLKALMWNVLWYA